MNKYNEEMGELLIDGASVKQIKYCLTKGAEVNSLYQGTPALYQAAQNGMDEVIELLLDEGADIEILYEYYNETPICGAIEQGQLTTVALLIKRGANLDFRKRGEQSLQTIAEGSDFDTRDIIELLNNPECANKYLGDELSFAMAMRDNIIQRSIREEDPILTEIEGTVACNNLFLIGGLLYGTRAITKENRNTYELLIVEEASLNILHAIEGIRKIHFNTNEFIMVTMTNDDIAIFDIKTHQINPIIKANNFKMDNMVFCKKVIAGIETTKKDNESSCRILGLNEEHEEVWSHPIEQISMLIRHKHSIISITQLGSLTSYSPEDGHIIWDINIFDDVDNPEDIQLYTTINKPFYFNGKIVIPTSSKIIAIDCSTGESCWQYNIDEKSYANKNSSGQLVVLSENRIALLEMDTGKELEALAIDLDLGQYGSIVQLVVADQYWFAVTAKGILFTITSSSLEVKSSKILEDVVSPYAKSQLINGRLYIGTEIAMFTATNYDRIELSRIYDVKASEITEETL